MRMRNKRVMLGITGTNGAGKETVVKYLLKEKNFGHFSASGLITEEIIRRGNMPVNRDSMIVVANDMGVKYGAGYIVKELLRRAGESRSRTIIESIRTLGEVEELRKRKGALLAIDADPKIRYERIKKRGGDKDRVSFKEFEEQESREMESTDPNKQNLLACKRAADYVIDNDGTIKELEQKIKKILKDIERR